MTAGPGLRETFRQFARFLVVGSITTFADLVVYFMLVKLGAVPTVAKALSYATGTFLGFVGNKYWTFGSVRRSVTEPIIYIALYAVTLVVNVGMNGLVLYLLAGTLSLGWERVIAFVVAAGTTTMLNFLGLRFLAFQAGIRDRPQDFIGIEKLEEAKNSSVG